MYADLGVPLGQFDRNMGDNGWGLGGELLYRVQLNGPVWAGLGVHSFAFDNYSVRYIDMVDFFEIEERTVSRLFTAGGVMRFQPEIDFPVRPYIQGTLGVHWFFTNTKFEDVAVDDVFDTINENRESVLGYGLHAGFQVIIKRVPEVCADARVGYFKNASVEYMRYNAGLSGPGGFPIEYFERKETAVDLLGVHLGVSVFFSK